MPRNISIEQPFDYPVSMDRGDGIPRDANGYPYASYPAERAKLHQKVLNESWPLRDRDGFHARGIEPQPIERHIPVTVRIVFERDDETFLEGVATRWTRSHVFVELVDPRLRQMFIWVLARDVRRR